MEGKNRESFDINIVAQGVSLNGSEGLIEGVIGAEDDGIDLEITVQSKERGECMAYFFIQIEDGMPISFQVLSNFVGPIVKCTTPIIDYGLVKVNTKETFEIQIRNESPIVADVLVKNCKNERLQFNNMLQQVETSAEFIDSSIVPLVYDKPFVTSKSNVISFDHYNFKLQPFESKTVTISLHTSLPETIEEYFELLVRDGVSSYFKLMSEIQCPHVSLNRLVMNLGRIYAGVTEYVNL